MCTKAREPTGRYSIGVNASEQQPAGAVNTTVTTGFFI
jgi:hypothetical protein